LVAAGLLVRTIIAIRSVNPGFDANNVVTMRVSLTAPRFQKAAGVAALVEDSISRLRALPGVAFAATTCCLPLEDRTIGGVIITGRPLEGRSHGSVNISTISSSYFDVLRIPIVRGRAFQDKEAGGQVVVISEAMARRFWSNQSDALEAQLQFPSLPAQPWQIIGIAGDVRADGLTGNPPSIVYFPIAQAPEVLNTYLVRSPMAWIVRTHGAAYSLAVAAQKELTDSSGGLPVSSVRSMDTIRTHSFAGRQFNMLLLSIFGGAALLLAAIGIYGLMAFSVQQRRHEIAVRLAVGAAPHEVRNMVVFQSMRLTFMGLGIGVAVALGLQRFITTLLFGIQPNDAAVFISVIVILGGVALLSTCLPAYRASRVDPVEVLRAE
jgi:predicted permease